jgi:hypothetical protein
MCSGCSSSRHIEKLNDAYDVTIKLIKLASDEFTIERKESKFNIVPGWNDECKVLHAIARTCFLKWKESGRIRLGQLYEEMKMSRTNFKKALHLCKVNQNHIRKTKLANSFQHKNKEQFWKEINKLKIKNNNATSSIDGISDPNEVVNLFSDKYKSILDDPLCQNKTDNLSKKFNENSLNPNKKSIKISSESMNNAIKSLNPGIGLDGIHSNHLKYAPLVLKDFLSRLFTSFLLHNILPLNMIEGQIKPIIKNKLNDKKLSSNYRPIMCSSILLKLFEYCILDRVEEKMILNCRQYGFRKFSSCTMATAVLKETIHNYTSNGSNVHAAFIDLSKAFDKVNHNILLCKLIDLNIPHILKTTIYV